MQNDRELGRELDGEADRIIDAALPGYSRAEPRTGFEDRILVSARAVQPRPRRLFWLWLFTIPAAACLLLCVFLPWPNRPSRKDIDNASTSIPPTVSSQPKLAAAQPPPLHRPVARLRPGFTDSVSSLPKQDVFPTPSPLTAEERTMVTLSHTSIPLPKQPETATVNIEPVHIAELQIEPVVVPPLAASESTQTPTENTQP